MNKKRTLLFLRGLPGSGKSTYAKQLVNEEPDRWVRVNKDSLRAMLHDGKWSKGREKLILDTQRAMADHALASGLSVIVDDTNFASKHEEFYRQLAKKHGAEFELHEFQASVEECVERDLKRPNPVGKDVILKMFYQSCPPPTAFVSGLPSAVICDLDGTLALMNGKRGPFEWDKVGGDGVNKSVEIVLQAFSRLGLHHILLLSGRDGICRSETEMWLSDHSVHYHQLWMRPAGNTEKDVVIKRRIWEENIKDKFNVWAVFDDRPCVVRFWRSLGLFVFDCGNGYEF